MAVYLETHPPRRLQFYLTRSKKVTAIGLHTAENTTDLVLPDSGAEGVARYIADRTTAGSYASTVDSDSTVHVGRYEWTMFHIAGFNSSSLGLSWACQAAQWPSLPKVWVDAAIDRGAAEAARMSAWVKATYGWYIPARLLTGPVAKAGVLGFVTHRAIEDLTNPGRRTDPGTGFPFAQFFTRYIVHHEHLTGVRPPIHPSSGGSAMPDRSALIAAHQLELVALGYNLGTSGPNKNGVDGDFGPKTSAADGALVDRVQKAEARVKELEGRPVPPATPTPVQVAGERLVRALRAAHQVDLG